MKFKDCREEIVSGFIIHPWTKLPLTLYTYALVGIPHRHPWLLAEYRPSMGIKKGAVPLGTAPF